MINVDFDSLALYHSYCITNFYKSFNFIFFELLYLALHCDPLFSVTEVNNGSHCSKP